MDNLNSESLRALLRDLETSAATANEKLIQAEADHRTALKRSVTEGDHTLSVATEAALTEARINLDRAKVSVEVCRDMLREAMQRDKREAQATARAEIEAELASMDEDAADIDGAFAELVSRVMVLRAREISLRNKVRQTHREASGGPEHLSALRPTASFLTAAASCLSPDAPHHVARAVSSGARLIKAALDE